MSNAIQKLILNVSSQPYISIAKMFGGAVVNGQEYVYIKEHDALLIKKDLAKYKKHIKNKESWVKNRRVLIKQN